MRPWQDSDGIIGSQGRYWVVPGKFLAGPYPGSWEIDSQDGGISGLVQVGIRHFIDLTQKGESGSLDYWMNDRSSQPQNLSLTHSRFPIPDMGIPSLEGMHGILDHLDACLTRNIAFYLHCLGGLGRTGTVVGCFLVGRGFTGDEALKQLSILRRNTSNHWKNAPETVEQSKYVREWYRLHSSSHSR